MDDAGPPESSHVYLEDGNAAGSTASDKTPPFFSRFHRGLRPALILHTVTELPDGFILHRLSVFKPKFGGGGDGASLNLFHLLVCLEEN